MKAPLSFILIILGITIGLFLTAQWKTPPQRSVNPIAPFLALQQTDEDLTKEQKSLKEKITELQNSLDSESSPGQTNISKDLLNQAQALKEQAGLTEARGPGVVITLDDSGLKGTSDNISHAADLRDIVNILWRSGATAISINGERIVANTSIDCIVNTILINNTRTTAPYTILAIGDSRKLEKAVSDTNALPDLWKRVKSSGLVLKIETKYQVTIAAFNGSFPIKYSQAVE